MATLRKKIEAYLKEITDGEYHSEHWDMSVLSNTAGFKYELDAVRCTSSAMLIADKFKGKVYGYEVNEKTPGYSNDIIGEDCGGHDFAIVGHYLIDWWAKNVNCCGTDILDMTNHDDIKVIMEKYLPLTEWTETEMWQKHTNPVEELNSHLNDLIGHKEDRFSSSFIAFIYQLK